MSPFGGARIARRRLARSGFGLLPLAASWGPARASAWQAARGLGAARQWLAGGWRRPLLGIGALAGIAYAVERIPGVEDGTLFALWPLVALYLLLAFLVGVWRARTRVVVERFVDYSRPDEVDERPAHGLSALLVGELAALRDLYHAIDESRVIGAAVGSDQRAQPVQATVQVDDVGGFLENAASSESKISIGPLVLPLGTVLALFGRLAQGPRMGGGLHVVRAESDGAPVDVALLTAYFSGPGRLHHWRVSQELPAGGEELPQPALAGMVSELACRIFVDLALEGSVGWRAGRTFLDGLDVYRSSLHARADRKLKLQRAERLLVEALAEDERVPFVHYNLGVVYTELRGLTVGGDGADGVSQKEVYFSAAEQAFRHEIQRRPDRWEPYYALAQTYFDQGRLAEVTSLCDRVVELAPAAQHAAKAYDLKGLAEDRLGYLGAHVARRRLRASRRRAVAQAWVALLRAELRRRGVAEARAFLSRCLQNLAVPDAESWVLPGRVRSRVAFRRRRSLLRHAARLHGGGTAHLLLGVLALTNGRGELALRELKTAVRIAPTGPEQWAALAATDAALAREAAAAGHEERAAQWQDLARWACRQALNFVDCRTGPNCAETLETVGSVLESLGDYDRAARARSMLDVELALQQAQAPDAPELEQAPGEPNDPADGWRTGLAALRRGQLVPAVRAASYREAIARLESDFPEEVRRRGVRAMLARALAEDGDYGDALVEAERAIGLDPSSAFEREALGDVYFAMRDYEHAREAFESALLWEPNSVGLHRKLGSCHRQLAYWSNDPAARRGFLRQAERHYVNALDLYGPGHLSDKSQIHFALARVYSELGEFERVIPNVRNVVAGQAARVLVDVLAAEAFLRQRNHRVAEELLAGAIVNGKHLLDEDGYGPEADAGVDPTDPWPLGLVVPWGYWALARSYTDRDIRLDDAEQHLREAAECLARLPGEWSNLQAALLGAEGWIAHKRGNVDDAIRLLEESLGVEADPEVYLHLARAYAAKAARAKTEAARARLVERAISACGQARADASGQYAAEADELLARLEPAPAAPPSSQD